MDLPTDLLQEIFIRLPWKDVVICKCVCKSWYKLLSHRDFTASYATNAPFTTVVLEQVNEDPQSKSVALLQFGPNGDITPTPIDEKVPKYRVGEYLESTLHLVGAGNGLLFLLRRTCFSDHAIEKLYFSNPFSDECVEVAESKSIGEWDCEYEYKIGYIPKIDKYKVMTISYYRVNDDEVLGAKILTVGVDLESRIVDDPLDFLYFWSNGVSLMGSYHWISTKLDDNGDWNICTFDFLEEKCSGNIPKPTKLKRASFENMNLRVFNDRLSMIDTSHWAQITIWTMEEYGVANSWSKKVISCPLIKGIKADVYNVFTILPNGNIVLRLRGTGIFLSISNEKIQLTKVRVPLVDEDVDIHSTLCAATFAPRFYPLKEDTSGVIHRNVLLKHASSSYLSRFLCSFKRFLGYFYDLFQC